MSLRFKTIFGVALIEAVLLTLLISLGLGYLRSTNSEGMVKRAETTARLFAATTKDAVLSWDLASLDAFCRELLNNPDILYVRLTDASGKLLAQQGDETSLARPFQQDSSVSGVTDGSFDQLALIEEAGTLFGRVEMGLDIQPLNQQISRATQWSYLIAAGEMLLVALFSFILGSYLTRRLSILAGAARRISSGQISVELETGSRDEVGAVAEAFNEMSRGLQRADQQRDEYESSLRQLNSELEQRVARRTQKLTEKNQQLITTNKQLQETQQKLVQSQKMASLGVMAAGMAHEINNPVGVINSNQQTLQDYLDEFSTLLEKVRACGDPELSRWLVQQDFAYIEQDLQELIRSSNNSTQRIIAIIKGLQAFSKQEQTDNESEQALNPLLIGLCEQLQREASNGVEIRFALNATAAISYPASRIKQIVPQVVRNALQAVADDGQVKLTSQLSEQGFSLCVIDNGCGIAPQQLDAIFDPFYTGWDVGEGAGLGLSIVYSSLQEINGSVDVQSVPGRGTAVRLHFPLPTQAS